MAGFINEGFFFFFFQETQLMHPCTHKELETVIVKI